MAIQRHDITSGPGPRMSRCVVNGDMVDLAGLVARDSTKDVKGQTQDILDHIDAYLQKAGTSKSQPLTARLSLTAKTNFADLNAVWNAWVDPENPPGRACVQAQLARPDILLEIMVTATK